MAEAKKADNAPNWEDLPEIPREEQPYSLPEGWKWVYLSAVAKWASGGTPSRKHPEYFSGKFFWLKSGELNDGDIYSTEEQITQEAINHSSAKLFAPETVIMAMYGATIGKIGILKIEAATNQACACAICHNFIFNKYLFFYFLSQRDEFIKKGKGGAQPNISQEVIKNYPIPLPPLSIQRQIVSRIEGLFARLDLAYEKIKAVIESHQARKQAILQLAFSGGLTQNFPAPDAAQYADLPEIPREEQPYALPEGWKWVRLGDINFYLSKNIAPYDFPNDKFELYSVPSSENNFPEILMGKEIGSIKHLVSAGDVLLCKINPRINRVWYVSKYTNHILLASSEWIIFRNPSIDYLFITWCMRSDYFREYILSNVSGVGGSLMRAKPKYVKNYPIPLPPLSSQQRIVEIIEPLFAKMEKSLEAARAALAKIAQLKKAILARAFRGELS